MDQRQREERRDTELTGLQELTQAIGSLSREEEFYSTINARIADIDALLSKQLNEIMHHAEFQELEGSWRGLHYLVHQSETSTILNINVLNSSKDDLRRDL